MSLRELLDAVGQRVRQELQQQQQPAERSTVAAGIMDPGKLLACGSMLPLYGCYMLHTTLYKIRQAGMHGVFSADRQYYLTQVCTGR